MCFKHFKNEQNITIKRDGQSQIFQYMVEEVIVI